MKRRLLNRMLAYLPAFAFALPYVIYEYLTVDAAKTVPPVQFFSTIIKIFLILGAISLGARKAIKDDVKTGLAVWFATIVWFFTEKIFIFAITLSGILVLLWLGISLLRKKKIILINISFLLTVLGFEGAVLLLAGAVPWNIYLKPPPEIKELPHAVLDVPAAPPDIYYIVLDGYARADVLNDLYGFDPSDFTNSLLEKGFILPGDNHSNYIDTVFSIGSTLNMQYIQTLLPDAEGLPFKWMMADAIENNQVRRMLEESGYASAAVYVDWALTNIESANHFFKPPSLPVNIFEQILFKSSPLRVFSPLVEKLVFLESYTAHRKTVNDAFNALSEIPSLDSPKFVFAHIIVPHPPFIFDEDGRPVEPGYPFSFADGAEFPESMEQYRAGYVKQLQHVNRQLEKTIDLILEQSKTPPIIIIMSDHGSRMTPYAVSSPDNFLRERFSNFAAFHFPGSDNDAIPADITSVNVFRLIFDRYFGTEFGLLANEYYLSDEGFSFINVTSCLTSGCDALPRSTIPVK